MTHSEHTLVSLVSHFEQLVMAKQGSDEQLLELRV